ncbi:MAG TPA: TauD/TfdA family dioxygenase [Acidimicrobiales bacterium]|nr:TauD/TfdA family dioxygenase [Acidimicrobiales bacterium]
MASRQPIESPAVWRARDVADDAQWTWRLSHVERDAITTAARSAATLGRTTSTLTRSQFDLPALRPLVSASLASLLQGQGFILIRGFPIGELSPVETELAYVGFGLQLGSPVGQDADATLLGHVRDERVSRTDPGVRLYRTSQRQDFHTDGSDIVGLLCLSSARMGGESRIASSFGIYNEILRRRPDLLEVLYEPMFWDRNNEESSGEDPFFSLPVLNDVSGSPRLFYIGWYIRDAQRHPGVPRLTKAQKEAMNFIESMANDPEHHLEMTFEPGDVQLLSNAKILHSREAYEDYDEPERRRHLLRLWLTTYDVASVDDVLRGGIPKRDGVASEEG